MLPLDKMADQNVPRYQHINVTGFVNFFLKCGLFIMEGERCALCNWWSNFVMAVLIYYIFAIVHNSIWLLSYYIFVDQSSLRSMLSVFAWTNGYTIHSIAIKICFLWTILFGCFGCLVDFKEHFGCQQTQMFSMYGFSTLTKAFQDPSALFVRCSWI